MILFVVLSFSTLIIVLSLMISYELRHKILSFFKSILPNSKKKLSRAKNFAQQMNHAASTNQTQTLWHLQQWWILIAGFFLLSSILIFAVTRPIDPTRIEAEYLKKVDPQIYALLNGEILSPPPEVDEKLVDDAIVQALQLDKEYKASNSTEFTAPTASIPTVQNNPEVEEMHGHFDTSLINRKWEHLNPRYRQRLLMVFKIMKEHHDYELVLLEGYRSPARQNKLSGNANTTRAKAFQSYHQFGLAADVAFKRNGKVVISERDPWAWRGYQLYGEVAESVGLTWGGRWKTIHDYGHTEYRMPGFKKKAPS